jgi:hypothetical protein
MSSRSPSTLAPKNTISSSGSAASSFANLSAQCERLTASSCSSQSWISAIVDGFIS